MTRYVALLRGINVGGRNIIRMDALRACFEAAGFSAVATYIQSGNVLFSSAVARPATLTRRLEAALGTAFDYRASVVLRTREQMREVVAHAPQGFGSEPTRYRYDVVFLKHPLTAAAAIGSVSVKPGVDQAHAGSEVLYFSRLVSKASQSHLTRLVSMPVYQAMTIRNWNTTSKLLALMEECGAGGRQGRGEEG